MNQESLAYLGSDEIPWSIVGEFKICHQNQEQSGAFACRRWMEYGVGWLEGGGILFIDQTPRFWDCSRIIFSDGVRKEEDSC